MDSHRIEGIKFDFDRLTDDELTGIRGHLLQTHQRVTDEIGLIESTLFARSHDQLPLDSIQALGSTALVVEHPDA